MNTTHLMTRHPVVCYPTDTAFDAARLMREKNVGVLPVVTGDEHFLAGIVTDRDLMMRVDAAGRDPASTPIADIMTANPVSCGPLTSYADILGLMTDHGFRRLPVVDAENRLAGIVTLDDLLPYVDWHDRPKPKFAKRKPVFAAGAGLCLAAGLGAGLMYLLDPANGRARRRRIRELESRVLTAASELRGKWHCPEVAPKSLTATR